ncbi:glycosyltransferase [candidate division KSB1 bacterium]|nr:glycosyltransferase [candidate division KSB1 bacterium]
MKAVAKANILHLVNGFAIGGAELKLLELVKLIQKHYSNKFNQVVCSVGQGGPLQKRFEALGVKTVIFPKRHKFDLTLVFKVAKLIRREKIDIVQTTLFYADIIGAIAAKLAGVSAVISWETVSHSQNYMHSRWHRRIAYKFAMKVVFKIAAVSAEVKASLLKLRKIEASKVQIIHYGVDTEKFRKQNFSHKRKELGINGATTVLGVVGRLEPVKGHKYLIDALAGVIGKFPDTVCIFVGGGEFRDELELQAEKLALKEHVIFLGFRDDVFELLNIFDIFILPSVSEGLPNVLLEAMSCSVPAIATSVGGIPEVISHGQNGLLVPPENSAKLNAAILDLLADPQERIQIGMRARKTVQDAFSVDKQVEKFVSLYEESLNGI